MISSTARVQADCSTLCYRFVSQKNVRLTISVTRLISTVPALSHQRRPERGSKNTSPSTENRTGTNGSRRSHDQESRSCWTASSAGTNVSDDYFCDTLSRRKSLCRAR